MSLRDPGGQEGGKKNCLGTRDNDRIGYERYCRVLVLFAVKISFHEDLKGHEGIKC